MKSPSEEYSGLEAAAGRQPCELYRFRLGETYWYYTSGDAEVEYDGETYAPAVIVRSAVSQGDELEPAETELTVAADLPPAAPYLSSAPATPVEVDVYKIFRDQDPLEAVTIFTGLVEEASPKGLTVELKCLGPQAALDLDVPQFCYQPQCNWEFGSEECGVDLEALAVAASGTVSDDGLVYTSEDFGGRAENYFQYGSIELGGYKAMIASSVDNTVTLARAVPGVSGTFADAAAYPGCAATCDACLNKWDNIANFGGFPWIPFDNPVLWLNR